MLVPFKIYAGWMYSEDAEQKQEFNRCIYNELLEVYSVAREIVEYDANTRQFVPVNFDEYDIVLDPRPCYAHVEYRIAKNDTDLDETELALICDHGNLGFGYTTKDNDIYVFTE